MMEANLQKICPPNLTSVTQPVEVPKKLGSGGNETCQTAEHRGEALTGPPVAGHFATKVIDHAASGD